jgi:cephalosporin hydroxylase
MTHSLTDLADECGTDKGTHQGFMPYYAKHLPGQHKPVILCEFGVHTGASLRMWSKYYWHKNSRIMGLDVNMDLYEPVVDDLRVEAYKADCTSRDAAIILGAMRPVDVIIDDASHEGPDVSKAFEAWWPELQYGGLYVVEDTHCSYNTDHYRSAGPPGTVYTMMEFLKLLADDVNWGIHGYDRFTPMFKDIASVHFYPGICFIQKKVA